MTLIKDPAAPATPAQLNFLKNLVTERDLPETCERARLALDLGVLTKGKASEFISALTQAPKKATKTGTFAVTHPPLQQTAKPVTQDDGSVAMLATPQLTELPAWGYYDIDGTIYHWGVTSKDHYPTLRRLHVVTNYDGTKKGSWKKAYIKWDPKMQVEGTWTPYDGKGYNKTPVTKKITVPAQLVGKTPMTLDEAKAKGKAFTFCVKCGATLTDPVSVANGIGPVCIKAFV
jgi:hypothetical protein